jgi:hypothetical protein
MKLIPKEKAGEFFWRLQSIWKTFWHHWIDVDGVCDLAFGKVMAQAYS